MYKTYGNFVYLDDEEKLNILMNDANNAHIIKLSCKYVYLGTKIYSVQIMLCNVNAFDHTFVLYLYLKSLISPVGWVHVLCYIMLHSIINIICTM